jgi:hypothetical protein
MNFDLNIDNYTRDELIDMFELPSNFDKNIVEIKESKLRDTIINNKDINKETQLETINFIVKAKNIILNNNKQNKNETESAFINVLSDIYNSQNQLKKTELVDKNEHMVQVNSVQPHLSSYPSEFFQGVINPIKKRTITKILNIDSRFRDNYYNTSSTNYSIALPTNFNDVLQIQLLSIEIPQTYYNISKQYGNNFFTVVVDGNSQVVNIPEGNYDPTTISTIINNQLTNLGGDFACVVFVCNYINFTSVATGTGQMLVGFNGNQSQGQNATLELNFQADRFGLDDRSTPLPLKLGWILGFRNGIYINNQNYVSEGVFDYTGPRYFFLVVDDYNNSVVNNFYGAFNSSVLNKNILARISAQISSGYNMLEQNNMRNITPAREYMGPVNLNNLTIQLLDEYGRVVNLNNMDFSFSIQMTTVYNI